MSYSYIDLSETILSRFRMSLRWLVLALLLVVILFGGLAFLFRGIPILFIGMLLFLGVMIVSLLIYYYSVLYLITEKKIYKRSGFPWRKVLSARHREVTDIAVVQGVFQRFFLNMGTIKVNTSGSIGFEIIMPRVSDPFQRRKDIYEVIRKHTSEEKRR